LGRKKASVVPVETRFSREPSMICDGFEVVRGDIIKVSGQYGLKFKFDSVVTNKDTGAKWVDCFELYRGVSQCFRSFDLNQIKRIPQKGKRSVRKHKTHVVSN
jgi:hypothetical protein